MDYNATDNLVIQDTYDHLDRICIKNYYLPAKLETVGGNVKRVPKKLIYQDRYDYKLSYGIENVDIKRIFIPELSKPKLVNDSVSNGVIEVSISIIYKSRITTKTSYAVGWGFAWSQSSAFDLFEKLSRNASSLNRAEVSLGGDKEVSQLKQGENVLQITGLPTNTNVWVRGYVQVETGRIYSPPAQFYVPNI